MNLNALDLNLVRVLDAILRARSVTRAGEQIGLSQPAVSAALNRLRHLLDDQLFVRRGNDMVPTPRAEEAALPVRAALRRDRARLPAGDSAFDPAAAERTFTLHGRGFLLGPADAVTGASACRDGSAARRAAPARQRASAMSPALLQDDLIDAALEPAAARCRTGSIEHARCSSLPFAVIAAKDNAAIKNAGIAAGASLPLELFCDLPHALRSIDGSMSAIHR